MAEPAAEPLPPPARRKPRWRAWLRAIHRDVGYLAVGFTLIYAISGLAMNHIGDWDPNFVSAERVVAIPPLTDNTTEEQAVAMVTQAAGTGAPDKVLHAGDEVHLDYDDGTKVVAIGDTVVIQERSPRLFLRVANWLHATRGKPTWKYISDAYAVLLLYLAISGLFMIKGRLGLRWRGTLLVSLGVAVPIAYLVISGGPGAETAEIAETEARPADGIRLLSPDENPPE
jgi:uncharacterized protein